MSSTKKTHHKLSSYFNSVASMDLAEGNKQRDFEMLNQFKLFPDFTFHMTLCQNPSAYLLQLVP